MKKTHWLAVSLAAFAVVTVAILTHDSPQPSPKALGEAASTKTRLTTLTRNDSAPWFSTIAQLTGQRHVANLPWAAALADAKSSHRGVWLTAPSQQESNDFNDRAAKSQKGGGPLLVAIARPIPEANQLHSLAAGNWREASDGYRYVAVSLASADAKSLSAVVQFQNNDAAAQLDQASVLFTDRQGKIAEEIPLATLVGEKRPRYTVPVSGDTMNIVVKSPLNAPVPSALSVRVSQVSHAPEDFVLASANVRQLSTIDNSPGAAIGDRVSVPAECAKQNGQSTYSAAYRDAMNASVKIMIRGIQFCSGTIVRGPKGPALLTAKHCIDGLNNVSNQVLADSIAIEYFGRKQCGSDVLDSRQTWVSNGTGGGKLYQTATVGDITQIEIKAQVPAEARNINFGYAPAKQSPSETYIALTHPYGRPLELFEGKAVAAASGSATATTLLAKTPSPPPGPDPFAERRTTSYDFAMSEAKGIILPGSSGGGLFTYRDGHYVVIGVTSSATIIDHNAPRDDINNITHVHFEVYPQSLYTLVKAEMADDRVIDNPPKVTLQMIYAPQSAYIARNDRVVVYGVQPLVVYPIEPPEAGESTKVQLFHYGRGNGGTARAYLQVNKEDVVIFHKQWASTINILEIGKYTVHGPLPYSLVSFDSEAGSNTGYCFNTPSSGASGTAQCLNNDNQKWYFRSADAAGYRKICSKSTQKCLERSGSSVSASSKDAASCNSDACMWKLDNLNRLINKESGDSLCVQSTPMGAASLVSCDPSALRQQWQLIRQ